MVMLVRILLYHVVCLALHELFLYFFVTSAFLQMVAIHRQILWLIVLKLCLQIRAFGLFIHNAICLLWIDKIDSAGVS